MAKASLQLQQLNDKMLAFTALKQVTVPPTGWIKAIRIVLGMSMQQLGKRLSISKQAVRDMENREKEGTISVKSLKQVAEAMDMQFVYGFVPRDGSLEALIDRRATELARQIVMRTAHTMKLEDQANTQQRLEAAIRERAAEIKTDNPKILWD